MPTLGQLLNDLPTRQYVLSAQASQGSKELGGLETRGQRFLFRTGIQSQVESVSGLNFFFENVHYSILCTKYVASNIKMQR